MKYDIAVIGGGASGMMAAIIAAQHGASVVIIEKNAELGNKLAITGGGRCNIYNVESNVRTLLKNYGEAEKFLYSAFSTFGIDKTKAFFESIGIQTFVETKNRAFPVSESAKDVVNALSKKIDELGVTTLLSTAVKSINVKSNEVLSISTPAEDFEAKKYILATGGVAYPETGSTGDGFKWLKDIGHNVISPTPNITPLTTSAIWGEKLSGVRIENTKTSFWQADTKQFSVQGDVLFTHFGLSGPSILNVSERVSDLLQAGDVTAVIDCVPTLNHEELHSHVIKLFEEHPAKQLKQILKMIASGKLSSYIIDQYAENIDFTKKTSEVSKDTRSTLVSALKEFKAPIEGLMGMDKAVVADGGIPLNEVDMRTMCSNLVSNLYVAGDLLHINRPSGGFSLQLCWTTGYLAGISAAKTIK